MFRVETGEERGCLILITYEREIIIYACIPLTRYICYPKKNFFSQC